MGQEVWKNLNKHTAAKQCLIIFESKQSRRYLSIKKKKKPKKIKKATQGVF